MTRYQDLQRAFAAHQSWETDTWRTRKVQTIAAAKLVRKIQEAVADELGLTEQDRRNVYQSSGRDFNDPTADDTGHAVHTTFTEHRVCLNVKVALPDDPRRAHVAYAVLVIREASGTRYKVGIGGVDTTLAEIDVENDDPTTFCRLAKLLTSTVLEFYTSRPDSELDGSGRARIGFSVGSEHRRA